MSLPECEKYHGRLRECCEGTALSPEKTDRWRIRRHLQPLFSPPVVFMGGPPPVQHIPLKEYPVGPGTELKELLAELGITYTPDCGCEGRMQEMNRLGVAGCRQELPRLAEQLRAAAEKAAMTTIKAHTAWRALVIGVAWQCLGDRYVGLITEAIARAERKQLG